MSYVLPQSNRVNKNIKTIIYSLTEMFLVEKSEAVETLNDLSFWNRVANKIHLFLALNLVEEQFIKHKLFLMVNVLIEMNVEALYRTLFWQNYPV